MSVQMSQVLPLAKDKATNSELKLAVLAKTDSCIESSSKIGGRVLYKSSQGGGYLDFCVGNWCVYVVCD